tara:strand:- start:390 stop:908 length:519 start_codon:yes stop_codon:yes gene_type:complete
MRDRWEEITESWLKSTSLSQDMALWAFKALGRNQVSIESIEESEKLSGGKKSNFAEIDENARIVRKKIKNAITEKENSLDDISLNTPNTYKLQISIPSNLNYLMKAWAAAEGRDLSGVALLCIETGLRSLKASGSIPRAAISRYNKSCEKRIALAEANNVWDRYEKSLLQSK